MATRTKNKNMDELISDFSRFYILVILFEGSTHGYSIISRFKKTVKKEVIPSIVCQFLKQLEKKGLVTPTVNSVGETGKKSLNSLETTENYALIFSNVSPTSF